MTLTQQPKESFAAAAALLRSCDVWEMTLPWLPVYWDIEILARYKRAGYTFVSATLQDWPPTLDGMRGAIDRFRALAACDAPWLAFASTLADIDRGRQEGKLVLGLNSQETLPVAEDLANLESLHALGIRHMLLAYNVRNRVADGCAEASNAGLSNFGRRLIREMNRAGIIVDCSHTGQRSSLEAMSLSERPVIFSHSNPAALYAHVRNLSDEQIRACAATGGVIGIVGVGAYLGDPNAQTDTLFHHIDYVASLVGAAHVGLGTDFVNIFPAHEHQARWDEIADIQKSWPDPIDAWPNPSGLQLAAEATRCFSPEQLLPLVDLMLLHQYPTEAIKGILGANFRRIYAQIM
ncbi:MAG TPA: membrane dipeptidase [Steroidobacteraceae bacterium]|nr:membrane dipeptidase [Steroidobacteraceae bacterium]